MAFDFPSNDLGCIQQVDARVVERPPSLPAPGNAPIVRAGSSHLWLSKRFVLRLLRVEVIESSRDISGNLQVLSLILPHRDLRCLRYRVTIAPCSNISTWYRRMSAALGTG